MTQENKQLLFVDLSSRLPYGVKCFHPYGVGELDSIDVEDYGIDITFKTPDDNYYSIEECKPYLRSMSSMTAEESKEYYKTFWYRDESIVSNNGEGRITLHSFDWLNEHHFDYRGLIEKGLALEAPEGMYEWN